MVPPLKLTYYIIILAIMRVVGGSIRFLIFVLDDERTVLISHKEC